ncbi:MAG: hypothetical protein MZU84_08965 [Sphingobacterium sp.]|nr:hypothetical protein [Sphingobacterium sp.]
MTLRSRPPRPSRRFPTSRPLRARKPAPADRSAASKRMVSGIRNRELRMPYWIHLSSSRRAGGTCSGKGPCPSIQSLNAFSPAIQGSEPR